MNLVVVGAGFVGLVTAAVFADFKNKVWVVDVDKKKIKDIISGKMPFYEPGLDSLISKNIKAGRLNFTDSYSQAIPSAEIIFICVGTPNKNKKINLSYLYSAINSVARNLKKPSIIVIKSTVPPGINEKLRILIKKVSKVDFDLASMPEFLKEGKALEDTLHPYRVIVGSSKKFVVDRLLKLHKPISGKRLICDEISAQIIKYASNAFLPTKISFANAIAILCDKLNAQTDKVLKGLGMDRRIGSEFLKAGIGYGGSCFPKDIEALVTFSEGLGYDFCLLKAVKKINDNQVNYFIEKLKKLMDNSLRNKRIVILGLSFKPETSDIRESRSLYVIKKLKKLKAEIRACDPIAIKETKKEIKGVRFFTDPYKALKGASALFLLTEWQEYQNLDFNKIKKLMKEPIVIDGRNIYNRLKLERLGFIYEGLGKN